MAPMGEDLAFFVLGGWLVGLTRAGSASLTYPDKQEQPRTGTEPKAITWQALACTPTDRHGRLAYAFSWATRFLTIQLPSEYRQPLGHG